jgi:sulfatase maturation enzyme AslB (radical SAM superfamily)
MSSELSKEHTKLILDGTKISWHEDRVAAWEKGERIAPITIDMALTRACNYGCHYCYAMMQENDRVPITKQVITNFLDDCKEIGVKGISLVSDGESTLSPVFVDSIVHGSKNGINMAVGTNAYVLNERKLEEILPHLTYLRVNISAGEPKRYAQIMGVREDSFHRVCENIRTMMRIKKEKNLNVTIGLQMVLMPQDADQIMPLARLGKELRPDYLVIKHCSDNEDGFLGVDYSGYKKLYDTLHEAESLSDEGYQVTVKWSKIQDEGTRSYGEKYWEVMNNLASPDFNAQKMCGTLCLQHKVNEFLDGRQKGQIGVAKPTGITPEHLNFV